MSLGENSNNGPATLTKVKNLILIAKRVYFLKLIAICLLNAVSYSKSVCEIDYILSAAIENFTVGQNTLKLF